MRKLMWMLFLSCTLLMQSCFEIIEQVAVKADGSGTLQLVLNMSKSKTRLNSIMKMKTVNGHKVPDKTEINQKLADIQKDIKNTNGISAVKTSIDYENYIATLTCNFKDVESLNAGIKNVAVKAKSTKPIERAYDYHVSPGKVFSRLNRFLIKEEYDKMSNADKEIFATAGYTGIFKFESDVVGVSNKDSRISANKRNVMLKLNALDVISNKKSIENQIKIK